MVPAAPFLLAGRCFSQPPVRLPRLLTAPIECGAGEEGTNQAGFLSEKRLGE